jgi:hypothetical protein
MSYYVIQIRIASASIPATTASCRTSRSRKRHSISHMSHQALLFPLGLQLALQVLDLRLQILRCLSFFLQLGISISFLVFDCLELPCEALEADIALVQLVRGLEMAGDDKAEQEADDKCAGCAERILLG